MESIHAKKYIFGLFQIIIALVALNAAATAATYTVTTVNDGIGIPGSLREAILQANATSDANFFININIGAGGLKTISPTSPLPAINLANGTNVTIDATTMPGYAGAPLLQLSGLFAGASANGLYVFRGNVTVKGLIINNFAQYGILTDCPNGGCSLNNVSVYGCYIGTDSSGTVAQGNGHGIRVQTNESSAAQTTNIGGTAANQRNIISGNDGNGIVIDGPYTEEDINVFNNYIGTNVTGTAAVPNGVNGIYILDSYEFGTTTQPDIFIGCPNAAQRNVISGNGANGIRIIENTADVYVRGNYIGTNASGTGDLGNGANGVLADGPTANFYDIFIGGAAAGEGNTISGNNLNGVRNENNDELEIVGNRIGTNAAGTAAVPNTQDGVSLIVSSFYAVTKVVANTISGNGDDGIGIASDSTGIIEGNRIGVNAAGTGVVPN